MSEKKKRPPLEQTPTIPLSDAWRTPSDETLSVAPPPPPAPNKPRNLSSVGPPKRNPSGSAGFGPPPPGSSGKVGGSLAGSGKVGGSGGFGETRTGVTKPVVQKHRTRELDTRIIDPKQGSGPTPMQKWSVLAVCLVGGAVLMWLSRDAEGTPAQAVTPTFAATPFKPVGLHVYTVPPQAGARYSLEGPGAKIELWGTSEARLVPPGPGKYQLKVTAPGKEPYEQTVDLAGEQQLKVNF